VLKKISIGRLSTHKKMMRASRDPSFLAALIFQK